MLPPKAGNTPTTLYLLDTNVLVAYVRRNVLFQDIESEYGLLTVAQKPIVSVVSVGEIRALSREFVWGADKRRIMETLLAYTTIIPIPFGSVLDDYVDISEFCRASGRVLGKNDLWIAATARAAAATLLTTDRDFEPLAPDFLACQWIDPVLPSP